MLQVYGLPNANYGFFDLSNGVVGTTSGVTSDIEGKGDGWYWCWVTFTTGIVTGSHIIVVPGEIDDDYTFSGLTQESILAYGVQVETGDTPTPYFSTFGRSTPKKVVGSWVTLTRPTGMI